MIAQELIYPETLFLFLFCLTNSIAEMNFSFFSHFFYSLYWTKIVLHLPLLYPLPFVFLCVVKGSFLVSKHILEKEERYIFPSLGKSNKKFAFSFLIFLLWKKAKIWREKNFLEFFER